jgi:hypothetical protein
MVRKIKFVVFTLWTHIDQQTSHSDKIANIGRLINSASQEACLPNESMKTRFLKFGVFSSAQQMRMRQLPQLHLG